MDLGKCPGSYCGRMPITNESYSECGACERGFIRNNTDPNHACVMCTSNLETYDFLFLAFNCIVPLLIHLFLIDFTTKTPKKFSRQLLMIYLCAIFEVVFSAVLTVLLSEPKFSFEIYSCGVSSLSDFYTYFFNPTPNYDKTLICTQERVYPLQTIVLIFYSSCVASMLILRPFVMKSPINEKTSLYYALYAFPLLGLIYAVAGGFIYFSFPYISIIISCAANAGHFAMKQDMDMKQLLVSSCSLRNLIIIIGNWLLFSFGIVSIKEYAFLVLAPFSSIFYILTSKYTNPENSLFN